MHHSSTSTYIPNFIEIEETFCGRTDGRTDGHFFPSNIIRSTFGSRPKKVKVVDLYSASTRRVSKALRYSTHCQGIIQFYLHTLRFIHKLNEPYLLLPSQPHLRPWMDGRLSRPWCDVAPGEIRTCNLPTANPALYHTATSALLATSAPPPG